MVVSLHRYMGMVALGLLLTSFTALAESVCDPDGIQTSGSIYRICMPPLEQYNGNLVIWAHGFQDAGTPVQIPEDQLCFDGTCLPDLINGLGFGFATNSYSKTGLAVRQGVADILDLVAIFSAVKGPPAKVYLTGASEGGLITTLLMEGHPDVFSAGLSACGPVGDFPFQVNYFGDARATFEYFFPGVIPGDPFNPSQALIDIWSDYYELVVKPLVFGPQFRSQLNQWVAVARLPFDSDNYLQTVEQSVADVLRYSVINLNDGTITLGGFPFDNRKRLYTGSDNDLLLNLLVPRVDADTPAITEMQTFYNTSGQLARPLVTIHTLRDQQVPYLHDILYLLKTIAKGSFLARHITLPIDRFGHCQFTPGEALFAFILMLAYDANHQKLIGVGSFLQGDDLTRFTRLADDAGLPYQIQGDTLSIELSK